MDNLKPKVINFETYKSRKNSNTSIGTISKVVLNKKGDNQVFIFQGRNKNIVIENDESNNNSIYLLLSKYYDDRVLFLEQYKYIDEIQVRLDDSTSSYNVTSYVDSNGNKKVSICITLSKTIYHQYILNDKEFLRKYLNDILAKSDENASFTIDEAHSELPNAIVIGNYKKIYYEKELEPLFVSAVRIQLERLVNEATKKSK